MSRGGARGRAALALLTGLSLGLAVACAWLLRTRSPAGAPPSLADFPEDMRRELIRELGRETPGVYDSHPDPSVARVLRPDLAGVLLGDQPIHTNAWGMRERSYELPKPEGVFRIVLLGDSFVFGIGVPAQVRMGALLEARLEELSDVPPERIEVLHLGVPSWTAVAEAEYLRRRLGDLQPDAVVHLLVENDLDDNMGVRGFGTLAGHVPEAPERGDGLVQRGFPSGTGRPGLVNPLLDDLDRESRQRYERMSRTLGHLAEVLRDYRIGYLVLASFRDRNPVLRRHLEPTLGSEAVVYLPSSLRGPELRVSEKDGHWNAAGHERVARLLLGLLEARGDLAALQPDSDAEAVAYAREVAAEGRAEAERDPAPPPRMRSSLDLERMDRQALCQVYTGLTPFGVASPYVSLVLPSGGCTRLSLEGQFLPRRELAGGRVDVYVEEARVGELELAASGDFQRSWPLPEELRARTYVNVRLVATDWIHGAPDRRRTWSYRLRRIALE